MPSLSSSPRLGNTGLSSLLRSASSIQAAIQSNQDEAARIQFENNPNGANLDAYLSYLNTRINNLNATGNIADNTKAMALSQTATAAVAKNTSFTIQNMSIQVLTGNASNEDKLNTIGELYTRAASIGDMPLAQSLESQYYNLSQTIQQQAVASAEAAKTLAKANVTAIKAGYTDAMDQIRSQLQDVVSLTKTGGGHQLDAALGTLTDTLSKATKALTGEDLPKGAQANMGALVQAYFNAEFAFAQHASDALRASDPAEADKFARYDSNGNIVGGKAYDIMSNQAYISVPGAGNINANDATQWANNPNLFGTSTNLKGETVFTRNQTTGYQYVNGVLTPVTDQTRAEQLVAARKGSLGGIINSSTDNMKSQLEKLGFTVKSVNKDGTITASFTEKTDKWTQGKGPNADLASQSHLGRGDTVTLIPQANGTFQFAKGNNLFHIATDNKGLGAVFQGQSNGANKLISGQYGFNPSVNTLISNATQQQLQAKLQAAQLAANVAKTATNQPLAVTPVAQPKLAAPTAAPKVPTASAPYTAPASIKPGSNLTADQIAQARQAINSLLATGNQQLIQNTVSAIQKSAGYGNPYDQFKLTLLPTSPASSAGSGTQFTNSLVSGGLK